MAAVFITVYRQRTLPKINEERSVQGQISQIISMMSLCIKQDGHFSQLPDSVMLSIAQCQPDE